MRPVSVGGAAVHSSSCLLPWCLSFGHVGGNAPAIMLSLRLPNPTGTPHCVVHSSWIFCPPLDGLVYSSFQAGWHHAAQVE